MTVPRDAVVDTGLQQHVFVATGDRFEPREVTLGLQLADRVEVRSGLKDGERIVAAGVFPAGFGKPAARDGRAAAQRHGASRASEDTGRRRQDPHAGHRE
jgi:hypothetical protein